MIGRRGLAGLVAVTVVAGIAVWATAGGTPAAVQGRGERLLPALAEHVNDVRGLTVVAPEERFSVRSDGGTWLMTEKGGYPVKFETVKATLLELSELRREDPKTNNPDLYARIGVSDPTQPDADSVRVTAVGEDGVVLADVIVGDAGPVRGTRYVREPGQGRAWLVRGDVTLDRRAAGWLMTSIVELPSARVRSVVLTHADGEVVRAAKDAKDDVTWALADLPAGREPSSATVTQSLAGALERLDLDDVRSTAAAPLTEDDAVEAVFETFDGLRLTVRTAKEDEEHTWCSVAVEVLPDATDEVRAEGDTLRARVDGWVYALSAYRATNLRKRMADLTREATQPTPEFDEPPANEPQEESQPDEQADPSDPAELPAMVEPELPRG